MYVPVVVDRHKKLDKRESSICSAELRSFAARQRVKITGCCSDQGLNEADLKSAELKTSCPRWSIPA